MKKEIPIWEKSNLTIEEAAAYFNIGENKLRKLAADESCTFVLWVWGVSVVSPQRPGSIPATARTLGYN